MHGARLRVKEIIVHEADFTSSHGFRIDTSFPARLASTVIGQCG